MRVPKIELRLLAITFMVGLCMVACNVDGRWRQHESLETVDGMGIAPIDAANDVDIPEVDLVESVLDHRTQYRRDLSRLRDHYRRHGDVRKTIWAESELKGLRAVKQFKYFLDAEVAPKDLKATDSVPEANALLNHGLDLMKEGGHGVPVFYREDLMVEAANEFRTLIESYPTSDKIDDAAFYLGEIHRSYFRGQEFLAAQWYERAATWDPGTPHPATFHAAVLYDEFLQERGRALELYHGVLKSDSNVAHVRRATKRIQALSARRWTPSDRRTDVSTR